MSWREGPVRIDASFEQASIDVLDDSDPTNVMLALRSDTASDFKQRFCFRVIAEPRLSVTCRFMNVNEVAYPGAYDDYRACVSEDGHRWFRVATERDGDALTLTHASKAGQFLIATFPPYPRERKRRLIGAVRGSRHLRLRRAGHSIHGREIPLIEGGSTDSEAPRIWVLCRQHPGESMAEWFAEGFLRRLLDPDEDARLLLEHAWVSLVPCMNPDGASLGNHRMNAAGVDLNRAWLDPSRADSPEVLGVRELILSRGSDLFIDVHGDEEIPYVFASGSEGIPSRDDVTAASEDQIMRHLQAADASFQREHGYEPDGPGEADLRTASAWVAEHVGGAAITLEMPFKDDANHPDELAGWTPEKSMRLGAATIEAARRWLLESDETFV